VSTVRILADRSFLLVSASQNTNRAPTVTGPVVDLTKDCPDLQIRLLASEVADPVAAHERGATVINLAERYGIDRTTVLTHLRRQGVPRLFAERSIRSKSRPCRALRIWQLHPVGGP
jgi:hypothetical protein